MTTKQRKTRKSGKLVYAWGINDADYNVNPFVDGKRKICPIYRCWVHILERCFCDKFKAKNPTYTDCTVSLDWKNFSDFKEWMESQDWQGKEPDKDLIVKGNKHYSKDTVVFVSKDINLFLSVTNKGKLMLGVYFQKENKTKPYRASYKGKLVGYFHTELEAHLAWKAKKHEDACKLAELETDPRIIHALRTRYAGDDIYEA